MQNQKLENLLNLAISATEGEREKSLELNVGYNPIEREWDLIVKYVGSPSCVQSLATEVEELLSGYAIVRIKENRIEELAACPEVIYIEKPKRLFFQRELGKRISCITPATQQPLDLRGEGVLIGLLDSGIDFRNQDFKILNLWDQSTNREYSGEELERGMESSVDATGHGTAVAGILTSVAPESELIVVKLGVPEEGGFPRTIELMRGIDYVIRRAIGYGRPIAINISFGNTYGAHDGSSLLERYLDEVAAVWKSVICVGAGNEGNTAGHIGGRVLPNQDQVIELAVQELETTLNLQIWKAYFDEMDISFVTPSGVRVGPISEVLGTQRFQVGNTEILLYYGEPSPYSIDQEIFIEFLPRDTYINSGIWQIILTPRHIVTGQYAMWLPSQNVLLRGTEFLQPSPNRTVTIPSTSYRTIGVGAYDARTFVYADFSGRGPAGPGNRVKPDLVAPGVNIVTTAAGGGEIQVSGTSFATPFVTGSAALLMEWGIVRGNDPFLYGEKVKAYLLRGAKPLPGYVVYPNDEVGYGALCLEQSF